MKTKKTIIMLWAFLLLTANLLSQAPQKFNYQAVVRDNVGNALPDHAVGIKVSILQGSAEGVVVYSETHSTTTNALAFSSSDFTISIVFRSALEGGSS